MLLTAVLVCVVLIAMLVAFAWKMDKWHGCAAVAVLAVWVWNMQPANASTIKTVTEMDGVKYYDTMTTDPNESYNGTGARIDKLYRWLDAQCRGGHGDDKSTQDFCTMRDKIEVHN